MLDRNIQPGPTYRKWFFTISFKPREFWIGGRVEGSCDHVSLWPAGTPVMRGHGGRWVLVERNYFINPLPMVQVNVRWIRRTRG